jgi:hypothetical protein
MIYIFKGLKSNKSISIVWKKKIQYNYSILNDDAPNVEKKSKGYFFIYFYSIYYTCENLNSKKIWIRILFYLLKPSGRNKNTIDQNDWLEEVSKTKKI